MPISTGQNLIRPVPQVIPMGNLVPQSVVRNAPLCHAPLLEAWEVDEPLVLSCANLGNPLATHGQIAFACFAQAATSLNIPPETASHWFNVIDTHYREPRRHYHTIDHIGAMCAVFKDHEAHFTEPDAVILAIMFHDVIYDPRAHDNEDKSIALFENFSADANLAFHVHTTVVELIDRTKKHDVHGATRPDTALFLDLDLEVLARNPDDYRRYAQQIRREYAHVPGPMFRHGRSAVLRHLLSGRTIYSSEPFLQKFEASAQRNVMAELQELDAQSKRPVNRVTRAGLRCISAMMTTWNHFCDKLGVKTTQH